MGSVVCNVLVIGLRACCSPMTRLWLPLTKKGWMFWLSGVKEWGVKINVGKSGIMHMRKKMVERCEVEYKVDGEMIPMLSSYKY